MYRISKGENAINQLIKTLAEDAAIATGAFAQSTVVAIDNEPTPSLIVEPPLPGRTLPYVRAWAQKYREALVVIGVHTPEFAFEVD